VAVDAGTIYSEVRIQLDKLRGDIKQVQLSMDKLGPVSKKASDTVAKNWKTGFNQIKFISAAAFAAVAMAVKAAVSTFAGFEQSLANVQSVAGATAEELAQLEEAAKEMGETTRFTASQAADALYYLASAGMDATESIDALEGVINLAGATGSDLAFTSEAVASSLSQFSLEAKDAGKVANVFTAAIQNSQATMTKLATSMSSVGPVASGLGHSIEETAGLLQILYNNGINASTAGTALRRAMSDLANSMSPAVKRLEEMGVAYDEVNPATNSFAEVIGRLGEAGLEAGEIMAIFGQRAGASMIKLIQAGRETVEEYTEAVTDTNAAAEAYAIQNDTLAGSFDRLKSATESAQISFVSNVAPVLRGLVDILTKVMKFVGGLPGPIQVLLGVMAVGIPVVLAAGSAIAFMTTALAGAGIALGAILGPITLVVGVLGLIAGAVSFFGAKLSETRREQDLMNEAAREARDVIREQITAVNELTNAQRIAIVTQQLARIENDLTSGSLRILYELYQRTGVAAGLLGMKLLEQAQLETELARLRGENVEQAQRAEFDLLVQQRELLRSAEDLTAAERRRLVAIQLRINLLDDLFRQQGVVLDEDDRIAERSRTLEGELALLQARYEVFGDEIDLVSEKAELYREAINNLIEEGTDPENTALLALIKTYRELVVQLDDAAGQEERVAEIMKGLSDQLSEVQSAYEVFGEEVDVNSQQQDAYREAIRALISEGLSPQSETMVELIALYRDLRAEEEAAETKAREKASRLETEARLETERQDRERRAQQEREAAQDMLLGLIEEYQRKTEEVGADQERLFELEIQRTEAQLRAAGLSSDAIEEALAQVREYQQAVIALTQEQERLAAVEAKIAEKRRLEAEAASDAQEEAALTIGVQATAQNAINAALADYDDRLLRLTGSQEELAAAERARVVETLSSAGVSEEAIQKVLDKVIEFQDVLRDDQAAKEFSKAITETMDLAFDQVEQLGNLLLAIISATTDRRIDEIDRLLEAELDGIDERLQAELEAAGVAEETTLERLQRELTEAIAAGDEETAQLRRDEITRTEIREQYAADQAALEAQYVRDKAHLEYEGALSSWKIQLVMTIAQAFQAALNAYTSTVAIPLIGPALAPAAAAVAAAFGAIQVGLVSKTRPEPPAFQTGGIVLPGTSSSGREVMVAEHGSAELMLNNSSEGQAFLREFAREIADEIRDPGNNLLQIQMYIDGRRIAESTAEYMNNGIIRIDL